MMAAAGYAVSVLGLASLYESVVTAMVIDETDRARAPELRTHGTLMPRPGHIPHLRCLKILSRGRTCRWSQGEGTALTRARPRHPRHIPPQVPLCYPISPSASGDMGRLGPWTRVILLRTV